MKTKQCPNCGRLFMAKLDSERPCPECKDEYEQKLMEQKETIMLGWG